MEEVDAAPHGVNVATESIEKTNELETLTQAARFAAAPRPQMANRARPGWWYVSPTDRLVQTKKPKRNGSYAFRARALLPTLSLDRSLATMTKRARSDAPKPAQFTRAATSQTRSRSPVQFPINSRVVVALERLATKHDGEIQARVDEVEHPQSIDQLVGWRMGVKAALELVRMTAEGVDPLEVIEKQRG